MADFVNLAGYKGWSILWHPTQHRLFIRSSGLFPKQHDFWEHPRDRVTAIEIAKAWIDDRR